MGLPRLTATADPLDLIDRIDYLMRENKRVLDMVSNQAEDEGLWFNARSASDAYLQQELRKLHELAELSLIT